jgi:hypothetical protein
VIALVAITDAGAPPPVAPLRAVGAGSLCALCVPVAEGESATVDALVDREELIERLMEDRDLLPVRFGADVPDERAAERVLAERHDELAAALDRVRGAVELSVRVAPVAADDPPAEHEPSGREYLRARIARSEVARGVHDRLAALSRAAVVRPGPELLRAAYLVDREAVPAFVAEVQRTQESRPELALLCTGPWAPFSFAGAEAAA